MRSLLYLSLALPAPLQAATTLPVLPAAQEAEELPGDKELLRRFKRLPRPMREEFVEAFIAESAWLEGFGAQLSRFMLEGVNERPENWPMAEEPTWFDPEEHTPGQKVRRKLLSEKSSQAKKARERMLGRIAVPRLESAYFYDYGARELRRIEVEKDYERVFRNGLAGFPPQLDIAQALVEQALDDGSQAAALGAFSRLYADRGGKVFPGITLYDAWSSGRTIEMPDVDALAILHVVLDDWRSYTAPVPGSKHDRLYKRIGELFEHARRHRGLRSALAQTYLVGRPVLRDGYGANLDAWHSLWESASSTPAELAPRLPDPEGWRAFLDEWTTKVGKDPKLRRAGEARRATLEADAARVRAALVRVLSELERAVVREKKAKREKKKEKGGR